MYCLSFLFYYTMINISYYLRLDSSYVTVIATSLFILIIFIVLDIFVVQMFWKWGFLTLVSVDSTQLVNIIHLHVCVECNYVFLFSLDDVICCRYQSSFICRMVRRMERMGQNKKKRTHGTIYYWKTGRRSKLSNALLLP